MISNICCSKLFVHVLTCVRTCACSSSWSTSQQFLLYHLTLCFITSIISAVVPSSSGWGTDKSTLLATTYSRREHSLLKRDRDRDKYMLTYPHIVTARQYQHGRKDFSTSIVYFLGTLGTFNAFKQYKAKYYKMLWSTIDAKKNLTCTFPNLPAIARREFATFELTISGTIFMLNFNWIDYRIFVCIIKILMNTRMKNFYLSRPPSPE
jgi:hypothetical protein